MTGKFYMCTTCKCVHTAKMIQPRNVPDALTPPAQRPGAMLGMSLSDYLLSEIREIAQRPTLAEMRDRLHPREPVNAQLDTVRILRERRDAR